MDRELKKTPLYELHETHGARFVEFAGYSMPVQYRRGIREEHLHTRSSAGLFDVSHMGQIRLSGAGIENAMERLVTGDISAMAPFRQRYTLLTNRQGGIIDDLMLTRTPDSLFLMVNAACKEADFAYLEKALGPGYRLEMLSDRALLALQGPQAAEVLAGLYQGCETMPFLSAVEADLDGTPCLVNRCGYTGEDGYEISVPSVHARKLAETFLQDPAVELIGLGARDTLRLEAGLCLFGHDINPATTPVEAGLTWVVAKKYRRGDAVPAQFPGADIILQQLQTGTALVRRGFTSQGKIPVRDGAGILNHEQRAVGWITSGGYGPSIGQPVAMGYIEQEYAAEGTELQVKIRNRLHGIRIVILPFVKHRYYQL
ncbi:MAG: glycine cleavage system aminomethyltransferase GcvT [Gammaproteobacteria bacterium]|nr:glycine cleavage system aminomethyltransferase GcvT [Gammaproteobacteria bacterium]